MQSEMPMKYWKNLPEAEIIPQLIANSEARVQSMLTTPERPVKPMPANSYLKALHQHRHKPAP